MADETIPLTLVEARCLASVQANADWRPAWHAQRVWPVPALNRPQRTPQGLAWAGGRLLRALLHRGLMYQGLSGRGSGRCEIRYLTAEGRLALARWRQAHQDPWRLTEEEHKRLAGLPAWVKYLLPVEYAKAGTHGQT